MTMVSALDMHTVDARAFSHIFWLSYQKVTRGEGSQLLCLENTQAAYGEAPLARNKDLLAAV